MALNELDIKIIVLVIFVFWLRLIWLSCEAKHILSLLLLVCPGFILMLAVLHLTWGPTFGEWLAAGG
jgi:hypothetical protein